MSAPLDQDRMGVTAPADSDELAQKADDLASPAQNTRKHISVIYFHGMGSQRRYEEISHLIDSLDEYAFYADETGTLADIKAALEPPRGTCKTDIAFVKCVLLRRRREAVVRFYEGYWAPITAGGVPSLQVLRWLLKQLPHPIAALRSPWRLRARLRRASLYRLWSRVEHRSRLPMSWSDVRLLLLKYDQFEGPEARRRFPEGTFKDFLGFLRSTIDERIRCDRLIQACHYWHLHYSASELFNELLLITIGLTALLAVVAAGYATFVGFKILSAVIASSTLQKFGLNEFFEPSLKNIVIVIGVVASLFGINSFLRDYLGDVQIWTTYEETDEKFAKRQEILEASRILTEHVLLDPDCERVVIIAHSLGTTVALDTLLAMGRYNRARPQADSTREN